VFLLEPIADNIFKFLMKCTETKWDDFAYDIVSEGVQCWLFIHFSSYSTAACLWFPVFCGVQVAMLILSKVLELCEASNAKSDAEKEEEQSNELGMSCMDCCNANAIVISSSITPLFLTLYQNNAPFRSASFDVVLTCFYWIGGLGGVLQNSMMHELIENGSIEQKGQCEKLGKLLKFLSFAFNFYMCVLAWIYWDSGDIEEDFDHGYMLHIIITGSILCGCLFCIGCAVMAGAPIGNGVGGLEMSRV